jgi:predicted component of type VI protein secretion system
MYARLSTCVSIAALCVLCPAVAWAQTEDEPQRAVEFVSGEARTLDFDRSRFSAGRFSARLCKVVATFETKPVLLGVPEAYVTSGALAAVFGREDPENPHNLRTLAAGRAWIGRTTVYADDEARAADLWTIAAIDEGTAKAVTQALLQSYAGNMHKTLEEKRAGLEKDLAKSQELQRTIEEWENQIRVNEEACRKLAVDRLGEQMINSAIARFEQERRLNEIDITGVNARLAATKERLEADQGQGDKSELGRALYRIQVELEIELIGKLARKEALAREIQQLEKGREARSKIDELRDKLATARHELALQEKRLSRLQESVQRLECIAAFTVTDNRVVISPIAPTSR